MAHLTDAAGPLASWIMGALALLALWLLLRRWRGPRFTAHPLLNRAEQRIFAMLGRAVPRAFGRSAHLFAQVSYGEFLSADDRRAFWTINARRADFLITDAAFFPLCVVEYQGSGHYGHNRAAARRAEHGDRMKRRALASAGVSLVELPPKVTVAELDAALAQAAQQARAFEAPGVTALRGA